jgi:hypothetical protein
MGETLGKRTPWGRSGGTDTAMVALGVESVGPCRCRESEPQRGVAGTGRYRSTHGPVEALEEVAVGGAVEVLVHPHRGVPQEPGHVLDAGAGLGQRLVANTWRRTGSPLLTTALGRRRPPSGREALREQKGASASRRPRAPLQPTAAERHGVAAAHWFAGSRAMTAKHPAPPAPMGSPNGPAHPAPLLCGWPRLNASIGNASELHPVLDRHRREPSKPFPDLPCYSFEPSLISARRSARRIASFTPDSRTDPETRDNSSRSP